jgi:phosphoglycolate phosphatase-like HAD superfamily hydrolase
VIGDTPRDVAAAHAIGAEIVAVATGGFDVEALRATGAARVLADLEGFTL